MDRAPDTSRTKHPLVLLTLLAPACIDPVANESTSQLGSSSTTGGPTAGTATDDTDSTADTDSTDGPSTGGHGLGEPCDLYLQDCAAGLKCMPYADDSGNYTTQAACFPVVPEPRSLGEPCHWTDGAWSGYDDCGLGQFCLIDVFALETMDLEGECRGLCLNDDPANDDHTTYACEDPSATPTLLFQNFFCTCETHCNPLADDCGDGRVCTFLEQFVCVADGSGDTGAAGDPCGGYAECDSGNLCMISEVIPGCENPIGCCSPFCDVTQPNACPGAAEGEICHPWYPPGEAPRGLEHIGMCRLPP